MDDARGWTLDDTGWTSDYGEQSPVGELEDRLKTFIHEVRQPVATVLALAEAARGLPGSSPEIDRYLDRIVGEVQEVSSAAWSLLTDDGAPPALESAVDLGEVVRSVLDSVALTWSGRLVRRGTEIRLWTAGSRAALRRCLMNVVDNAVRAAGAGGTVVVSMRCDDEALVIVEDDGPGFGHVPTRNGIGLRVATQVVAGLGGRLSTGRSAELGGGCVTLGLPVRLLAVPAPRTADHDCLPGPER
jgi:signal transduction histidine kinase